VDDPLPPLFAFVKLFGERGLFTSAGFTFFSWAPRLMSAKRSLVLTAGAEAEEFELNVGGAGGLPLPGIGGGGAPRDALRGGGGVTRFAGDTAGGTLALLEGDDCGVLLFGELFGGDFSAPLLSNFCR